MPKLTDMALCLDCDEVFEPEKSEYLCPKCARQYWIWLSNWLNRTKKEGMKKAS